MDRYPWILNNGDTADIQNHFSSQLRDRNCAEILEFSFWLANLAKPENESRLPWWKAGRFVESVMCVRCDESSNLLENTCTIFMRLYMKKQNEPSEDLQRLMLKFCGKCICSNNDHAREAGLELAYTGFRLHHDLRASSIGKYLLNKIKTLKFQIRILRQNITRNSARRF